MLELIREQLKGINLDQIKIDDLSEDEFRIFLEGIHSVAQNGALLKLINELIINQVEFTVKEAETMEQVSFGRATINGLSLLKEELEKFDTMYKQMTKKEEIFDRKEVL